MSFSIEQLPTDFETRYEKIEQANQDSFYINNPNRSFDAYLSVHSFGPPRDEVSSAAERTIAAGNMSPLGPYGPNVLFKEERVADAEENLLRFFDDIGIPGNTVRLLYPERDYSTPLTVVNIDDEELSKEALETELPIRANTSGDFMYSYDSNKILAARPADCPVMLATADTPNGKIHMLVHYSWQGAASQYVRQTAGIFDSLNVDRSSLEIYLTPGGQAESFPYQNATHPLEKWPESEGLFVNIREKKDASGETIYTYGVDTPHYVYKQVIKYFEVDPKQVYCDTSDTSAINSGYSSHGRSVRLEESNTRDIVLGVFK